LPLAISGLGENVDEGLSSSQPERVVGYIEARIKNFDRFAVIVDHEGTDRMIFKHAIATIRSPRSVGNYYATHDSH